MSVPNADHLPECWLATHPEDASDIACICNQLRACEIRVIVEFANASGDEQVRMAHTDALEAAREAVAALVRYDHNNYALVCQPDGWAIDRDEAFAAIDALRSPTAETP